MPTTPMSCTSICRRLSEAALLLACTGAMAQAVPAVAQAPAGAALAVAPPGAASAATTAASPVLANAAPAAALDTRIQDLKAEVIGLNRDLLVLEEELLFPANTQVAVFVSMDVGQLFELESVQVKLGEQVVASHLYTPREVQALHRGGMQRLHVGNLRAGEHELVAVFTGRGPHERDYKRGATLLGDKGTEAKYIELRIRDAQAKLQPEFEVKVWQ